MITGLQPVANNSVARRGQRCATWIGDRAIVKLRHDRWPAMRQVISFGPFRLFPMERLVEKDGVPIHIGRRSLDILICLAEHPGEVIAKRDLIDRVWADV